ncbi:YdcF family protein [Granulicella tundricola]|uniref:DUF218 domain-containing protein n=1 Tax=Granulicella tundricola (strain ATCC BAA-1859 / DSM 23138 / MP5ACTX9) TaxID=1198114 RepID=E8X325_GRATM|nr:YdcF family protein [Granulicella tundricola]ADW69249.1 protein of unknown function DUF218 [Granulicella tundricola MP5ACTX9]
MVKRLGWLFLFVMTLAVIAAMVTFEAMPTHNTDATHFDTIIVLGWPTAPDGKASKIQTARVMEAVRELMAGRAGHIIVSGGAAHSQFVEAEAMAKVAIEAGVPQEDVIVEGRAMNTIQNIY